MLKKKGKGKEIIHLLRSLFMFELVEMRRLTYIYISLVLVLMVKKGRGKRSFSYLSRSSVMLLHVKIH